MSTDTPLPEQPSLATSRSLGISAPDGEDDYELYLRVKSKPSVLGRVSSLVGSKGVDILWMNGQASDDKQTADFYMFMEMSAATLSASELVAELKKQDFVLEARSQKRDRVYFEGFAFPLTSGGHRRVMVLDALGWTGLVKNVLGKFGSAGQSMLHDEGAAFGQEVAERLLKRLADPEPAQVLDNLKALVKASGLGLVEISEVDDGESFRVSITESILRQGDGAKLTDDFLAGIIRGAIGRAYGGEYWVNGTRLEGERMVFELARESSAHPVAPARPGAENGAPKAPENT